MDFLFSFSYNICVIIDEGLRVAWNLSGYLEFRLENGVQKERRSKFFFKNNVQEAIDTEEVEEYNLKGFKTLLMFPKKKKDSKLTNSLLDMAKFQEIKIFFKIVISLLHRG